MKIELMPRAKFEHVHLLADRYGCNGQLRLTVLDEYGEDLCDISVDPTSSAPAGYMYINPSFSSSLVTFMEENGFAKKVCEIDQDSHIFPLMKLNLKKLKATAINGKAVF